MLRAKLLPITLRSLEHFSQMARQLEERLELCVGELDLQRRQVLFQVVE